MMSTREALASALFALLSGAVFNAPVQGRLQFALKSRKVKIWSDVAAGDMPALFLAEGDDSVIYQSETLPPETTISFTALIYVSAPADDKTAIGSVYLNVIGDAIAALFDPAPHENGKFTLGGLCSHCRIEGKTMRDPGDIDGIGVLAIPIKIFST